MDTLNPSSHTPMFNFADGACLQLAVLTIAHMWQLFPTWDEACELDICGDDRGLNLKFSMIRLSRNFGNIVRGSALLREDDGDAENLIRTVQRNASAFYENELDPKFVFLLAVLEAFLRKIRDENNPPRDHTDTFSPANMVQAIADSIEQTIQQDMIELIAACNQLRQTHDGRNLPAWRRGTELCGTASEYILKITRKIQDAIEIQFNDLDPTLSIGKAIADAIHERLLARLMESIHAMLPSFYRNSPEIQNNLASLYKEIAAYFSFDSRLLQDPELIWVGDDSESDIDEAEWQAVDPDHLENVLVGPEQVSVAEVSVQVPTTAESACLICFESPTSMRKIKVCGHVYCDYCLYSQLRSNHAARYRCAGCRAEFLQVR